MRYKKREEAAKRLTLWHAGRRRGINRIQEWSWLQHPGREQKFRKKKKNKVKAIKNDGQTKKTTEASQLPTPLCYSARVGNNSGWSTMVIPPPSSSTEIIKKKRNGVEIDLKYTEDY